MHGIGDVPAVGGRPTFWCPRCGTIQTANDLPEAPKLVERCRLFALAGANGGANRDIWQRLGIAEAIYPHEDRKT
jgi:hypothetical protein